MRVSRVSFLAAILFAISALPVTAVGGQPRYETEWQSAWAYREQNGHCELELALPAYGEVRFVASSASPMQFEFQALRDLQAGDLEIWRQAPDWHPEAPARDHIGAARHVLGGGSVKGGTLVDSMVVSLREGYHLELAAPSVVSESEDMSWEVKALNFQPAYSEFLDCARTNILVSWAKISKTRVPFDVDSHELGDAGLAQLDAVVRYVQNDPTIGQVYIDGHTDSTGDGRANRLLSKHRAEAVATYFKNSGLGEDRFVIRYHGAAYPVADNNTASGKAQNRRTTVRLERRLERGHTRLVTHNAPEK